MNMKFYTLLLFISLGFVLCSMGQIKEKEISGLVRSAEDGGPLPGVLIRVKDSPRSATSNQNGAYRIEVPERGILVFSYIGFKTREINITEKLVLDVELAPDNKSLNEVIVIGYGKQSREVLTTSVSKLDTKVLENVPYANAASALQGSITGLRVQSVNGQPGAAPRVILRGGTSINNPNGSSPLYIIDGVIRPNMNDINGDDIASLQVLKDAASTSIYGARGSNGVIIITTKSGKAGKMHIGYNYDLTVTDLANPVEFGNARDYIYYNRLGIAATAKKTPSRLNLLTNPTSAGTGNDLSNNTAYTTQFLTPQNQHKLDEGWESMPDPLDPAKTLIFKSTDFQNELFRTGYAQNHYISASGGSEKSTFNVGIGYLTDQGIAINTDFKRLTFNLNGDIAVSDKLKFFGRINYSSSNNRQVYNLNQIFQRSIGLPPTTKFMFEDGTLAPGQNRSIGNPAYHLDKTVGKNNYDNLTLVTGLHLDILPGLSFDPQVSLYKVTTDARSFTKAYLDGPGRLVSTRPSSGSYVSWYQQQADGVFTFLKLLGKGHNLDVKAGISYFKRDQATLSASGQNAASDLIPTLNAAGQPVNVSGTDTRQLIFGYFSRINYDYNQKYMVSLNARYDGASNLGAVNKWGFFPGISVGWNVHKENFWGALPQGLMTLKIRGSYGENGNISGLGDYDAQGEFGVGARYMGQAAVQSIRLANPDLQWEQSKTFDVGADVGLFKNRVNLIFDYYRKVTNDLLTNLNLPHATGFASILTNFGSLQNKGIEFEMVAAVLPEKTPLQWNLSFNAARVKTKILKLPYNGAENNRVGGVFVYDPSLGSYRWLGGLQEGSSIGDMFAYRQLGIYATDTEAAAGPVDMLVPGTNKTKFGGDVNWQDVDGNNIIDERDRVYAGNTFPTWTGGISSSWNYKNLGLTIRMDYTAGHTIYNYTRAQFVGQFQGDIGINDDVLRSWQNQGDITDIPKYYWADQAAQNNIFRGNSQFYERGDFLALREVSLSYTLPKNLVKKLKMSGVRFNVTGNNLHYFTRFKGLNPEEGGQDDGRYPVPRNIIFGANVSF